MPNVPLDTKRVETLKARNSHALSSFILVWGKQVFYMEHLEYQNLMTKRLEIS